MRGHLASVCDARVAGQAREEGSRRIRRSRGRVRCLGRGGRRIPPEKVGRWDDGSGGAGLTGEGGEGGWWLVGWWLGVGRAMPEMVADIASGSGGLGSP